ncbi:TfuA-related McrA-glycine thioamidation protein [Methanonatronarchaeum sp. AMET-Sl]|uniref:TfuA-related McrA-glycine thioamidation protein n=1 Tax=Methanonatronarchaeum sp. AMET-Sl TaxID=3037654 RepID=UPI00244DAAEB|nr:TfuA-related McrA-glycine thioamidation protein [Methanonatronarchaeum sp. AMET-Sl]WGI17621.1 TfuA-related McrA-glycine thioamidation protein [Methanonatronarchaeum sp. AMET-Sl]
MPDKKVVVYTGPSLHPKKTRQKIDARVCGPAERGDIKKAHKQGYNLICLIDGVFSQDCSVSHREILNALNNEVKVVGASSMGALRASELDRYGMKGIGEIYKRYKNEVIDSDDEVALTFTPTTYKPISEPLINIRYNLKKATENKIITKKEMNWLIKKSRSRFYPNRNYQKVIKDAREHPEINHQELREYLRENKVDLKQRDACKAIMYIKNMFQV